MAEPPPETCAVCGCELNRSGNYAGTTTEGRSHASKHHFVAERFSGVQRIGAARAERESSRLALGGMKVIVRSTATNATKSYCIIPCSSQRTSGYSRNLSCTAICTKGRSLITKRKLLDVWFYCMR